MSTKNTEERKQIEKRIESLRLEWRGKQEDVFRIEREMGSLEEEIRRLEIRLQALKPKAIKISDHAIVRYLERQCGVDVEAIRKSILESKLPEWVATVGGSGKFPVNGYQVVLKDYTVVTIN